MITFTCRTWLFAAALALAGAAPAHAQNFSLRWFTIDSGGGLSRSGLYALHSAIGQPDVRFSKDQRLAVDAASPGAASASADVYLIEGFLPGALGLMSNPRLALRRDGQSTVVLSWQVLPLEFLPLGTTNLSIPPDDWLPVPGETGIAGDDWEMNLRLIGPARFFRLVPDWKRKL